MIVKKKMSNLSHFSHREYHAFLKKHLPFCISTQVFRRSTTMAMFQIDNEMLKIFGPSAIKMTNGSLKFMTLDTDSRWDYFNLNFYFKSEEDAVFAMLTICGAG